MDLKFKTVPFEIKATSGDGSTGTGLASVFFNIDSAMEIVDDKGFDLDLPSFLIDGFVGGLNHDWDCPIGNPTEATPNNIGLSVGWKLSMTTHGKDVMILLKDKVVKKLSIGYRVLGDMLLETYDDVVAYWQTKGYKPNAEDVARAQGGYIRVLTRLKLYEFSPVTVPANSLAAITAVKTLQAKSLLYTDDTPVIPPTPTEADDSTPRLQKIKSCEALSEIEDILREAELTGSEAKALISSIHRLKALPREVASDDDGNQPDPPADSVTPEPDAVDASETPADADDATGKNADPADTVTPAPTSPLVPEDQPDDSELTPAEAEEKRLKESVARRLYEQKLAMDALVAPTIRRSAGA